MRLFLLTPQKMPLNWSVLWFRAAVLYYISFLPEMFATKIHAAHIVGNCFEQVSYLQLRRWRALTSRSLLSLCFCYFFDVKVNKSCSLSDRKPERKWLSKDADAFVLYSWLSCIMHWLPHYKVRYARSMSLVIMRDNKRTDLMKVNLRLLLLLNILAVVAERMDGEAPREQHYRAKY